MTKHNTEPNGQPPVRPPAAADRDWQAKIAIAKAAREHGKSLREGKPASFRSAVGRRS